MKWEWMSGNYQTTGKILSGNYFFASHQYSFSKGGIEKCVRPFKKSHRNN